MNDFKKLSELRDDDILYGIYTWNMTINKLNKPDLYESKASKVFHMKKRVKFSANTFEGDERETISGRRYSGTMIAWGDYLFIDKNVRDTLAAQWMSNSVIDSFRQNYKEGIDKTLNSLHEFCKEIIKERKQK